MTADSVAVSTHSAIIDRRYSSAFTNGICK
jgi:hypothetical protein